MGFTLRFISAFGGCGLTCQVDDQTEVQFYIWRCGLICQVHNDHKIHFCIWRCGQFCQAHKDNVGPMGKGNDIVHKQP